MPMAVLSHSLFLEVNCCVESSNLFRELVCGTAAQVSVEIAPPYRKSARAALKAIAKAPPVASSAAAAEWCDRIDHIEYELQP
jgi:hypothetical protein